MGMCTGARYLCIGLVLSLALPPPAGAGQHLVFGEQIAARLGAVAAERAGNRLKVETLLSGVVGAEAAAAHHLGTHSLRAGVAALSDEELRDLARRADALEADPVAGGVVKTLLILGIIVVVVVLLAAAIVKSCKEQGAECLD